MLTINHQTDDNRETIYEAHSVEYRGPLTPGEPSGCLVLHDAEPRSVERALFGGRAFVMNEAGATVATYLLYDPTEQVAA